VPPITPSWPQRDEDGQVVWPDDREERERLARRLFGSALVQAMDSYINQATDWVTNPLSAKTYEYENYLSVTDRTYRACFASMNDKQRDVTLHMIRSLLSGVLISTLSLLDQFDAEVMISLVGKSPDGQRIEVPITSADEELARQFIECNDEFGEHAIRLADDLKLPPHC
jgi:hypothetical protein